MKKATEVLNKLAAVEGVRAAVLVAGDGFPLEAVVKDEALSADEVAALVCDGVGAIRGMLSELEGGQFVQGVLEYSKGSLLLTNLPLKMTLVLIAARSANKARLWDAVAANFKEILAAL